MSLMVDLNADLGESFGTYKLGLDEELLNHITSANIACGFHAGDYMVMQKTVRMAVSKNVAVEPIQVFQIFKDLVAVTCNLHLKKLET